MPKIKELTDGRKGRGQKEGVRTCLADLDCCKGLIYCNFCFFDGCGEIILHVQMREHWTGDLLRFPWMWNSKFGGNT